MQRRRTEAQKEEDRKALPKKYADERQMQIDNAVQKVLKEQQWEALVSELAADDAEIKAFLEAAK